VKTISLKKVAAVAVASLGFGLLSVVPAQAAATLPIWVDTATTVGGVAITANTATVTRTLNTDVNAAAVASISAPAGSEVVFAVKSGAAFLTTDIIDLSINGVVVASGSPLSAAATATLAARTLPTPSVTTTYTYSIKVYANATGAAGTQRTTAGIISDIPVSVTVVAPTAFSAATSTTFIGASTLSAADTQALTANDEVRVSSAAGTNGAMVGIQIKNTSGTAYTGGATLSAQVLSGPGLVKFGASTDNYAAITDATVRADSSILAAGTSAANLAVTADGTNGTSEIRIQVLDSVTGAVLGTLPTVKMYFYGAPATVEVSQKYKYIAGNGTARGCSSATACIEDTFANSPIAVVTVKDSGGNLIPDATVSGVTSDGTVISAATMGTSSVKTLTTTAAAACAAGTGSCYGLGTYLSSVTGAAGAASGKTATVTYRALVSGTTFVTATPVTYTIGGAVATETLALSKTSYSPGEGMTVTRTAKDSAGNVPYDGQTANGVSFSKPQGGTAPGSSWYASGTKTSGANSLFAPVAGGAFNALMTSSVDGVTVITASASVTDANAALLTQIDALNAKIVALNALIAKIMKKLGVK
jgi:hypothetical protein